MLSINNISYYIGGRPIYQNASLHVKPKARIGLIGLNGKGKSTLLRLINNEYQVDEGTISYPKECKLGFLNQDLLEYQTDDSIFNVALQAFDDLLILQKKIDEVLKQMELNYEDKLVDKLTKLQEEFEIKGGYNLKSKTEEILEGIGFSTEDLDKPLRSFSGGWRMRVMLAKLLLEKPDLLMLDEPTNHLDLPSIQWIENYLKTYEGAVIIVSHDREFLNRTITSTVEVTGGKLVEYSGNYNFYVEEKELRKELQQNAYLNQQAKIKETERFIERFRAKATKSRQVQSRVKALDKIEMIEEVVNENATVNFRFNFNQTPGRFISTIEGASKAYGNNVIFDNTTAQIERGDKIALIGANGKGKSTLLRLISNNESLNEGESKLGHNVKLGFYAQHQLESLNKENTLLEELKQAGTDKTEQELRNVLGAFLFDGEAIEKRIKVLSGGEKSRVALSKVLISEANFLMLDEPTNHLDFQSVNILIQALQQYKGTYVLVSHDRHFVNQVANKIWWIENHEIKEYPGTYQEFLTWDEKRKKEALLENSKVSEKKKSKDSKKKPKRDNTTSNAIIKLKTKIEVVEKKIEEIESKKSKLEKTLSDTELYKDEALLLQKTNEHETVIEQLQQTNEEWEELMMELEELES